MSDRPPIPPRLAEWLARAASPGAGWRDISAGDLHEEFLSLAARCGPRAARRWYWRQAAGLAAEATARQARRTLGGLAAVARPKGDRPMIALVQEARLAWRALVHQPLASGIVILTLALGLGANIATFGMIDALILRPFVLPDVDRLIVISENSADDPFPQETIAPAHALAYDEPARSLTGAATFGWWDVNLAGPADAERVLGFRVSRTFFSLLGAVPLRGRLLDESDMVWGRHRQVVIGEGLWKRRFGANSGLVGTTIRLDGEPYTVAGILPASFTFPNGSEVWAPLAFDAETAVDQAGHRLTTFAKLAPGVSREAAAAELEARFTAISAPHPDANRGRRLVIRSFSDGMIDVGMPQVLYLWQAAALLVLLIGCTNVANLLLARGAARQRELAVRLAIGAGRWRLVRQLVAEGMVLALVATPAALGVAALIFRVLRVSMPAKLVRFIPGWDRMAVDAGLAGWAVVAALVTAIVFSLLPALQASRPNLTGTLRDGGRGMTGLSARSRLRRGLVVAEIALALPLLIASGLAAVGAQRFASGPQGYDPDGVLLARTILPEATYATPDARLAFAERLIDAARQIPGVDLAATSSVVPSTTSNQQRRLTIDGRPPDPDNPVNINYRAVSPDYLALLRVPILQGRAIERADREGTQPVVVISDSTARRFWPGESAVGKRVRLGDADQPWRTVVGVAGDTIDDWFMYRKEITAYVPVAQAPSVAVNLVIRTSREPAAYPDAVRAAVTGVDRTQPAFDVMTMRESLKVRTTGLRFISGLMAAFGALALVLATVGIYSVMAFYVAQRRHEMGIRMALGATAHDIVRLTVGQGARLATMGIVIGLALGVALARLMESALFGIVALEPWLFAAIAAVLAMAALSASLLPARHAARADPALALRST